MIKHEQCRLCGEDKPRCRTHIVPELAHNPIKNNKNQMYCLGRKVKIVQVGYREKMLCQECEALLSVYETKFKKCWMDTIPPDFNHLATGPADLITVRVPDYADFKLFHLSVFWRAAVSSGFKMHPRISLGKYEAQIRQMLQEGDPGESGNFPFFGVLSLYKNGRPNPSITKLAKGIGRLEGHHYYMMSYAYCAWLFVVARPGPTWMVDLEKKFYQGNPYPLLIVPYTPSKSFCLDADLLKQLREQ